MYLYGAKLVDQQNPLQKYYRQPKIYIRLPSNGKYYPPGTIDFSETGEYPVFAMTAKDELSFKTPDALLNGQATVDVIQSCIPAIKNAWLIPTIDLDAILIAIRIATYGESMDLNVRVPNTDIEKGFAVDLRVLLDRFTNIEFDENIFVDQFEVKIKPLTYKEYTESAMKTFEEQRIFSIVNNEDMDQSEKLKLFNQSFKKLTNLSIGTVVRSIASIEVEGNIVDNPKYIEDFVENCDKTFFKAVFDHIDQQKQKYNVPPIEIQATQEELEQGAPETYDVPLIFDQTNFFAQGS